MTTTNLYTYATKMQKKYGDSIILHPEWDDKKKHGKIEVRSAEHLSKTFTLEAMEGCMEEKGKLLFYTRGEIPELGLHDGKRVSFRKVTTAFLKALNPGEGSKTQQILLKERVQMMITEASALEMELVWIPRIMEKQLETEVAFNDTNADNGEGLTKADAYPITRMYKILQHGHHLTPTQVEEARKRLKKYWKQYGNMMVKN